MIFVRTTTVILLLATLMAPAYSQAIFHCKDSAGSIALQDSPCAAGSREKMVQPVARASTSVDNTQRRDQVAKLRAFANACTPKTSAKCIDFEARLRGIEFTMATVAEIDETKRTLQLNKDADIVNTRINHRIAKADYERADQRLSASYGGDNFSALLAERSEASARLGKARSQYYALTKTWLD